MSEIKFRPRFYIETSLDQKEASELIKKKLLQNNPNAFESSIIEGHLILKINVNNRHFWSPQMDISLNEIENEKGTLIRCLLAPAPAIWTMFMFFYTAVGFGAFIGIMIGLSQWTLEKEMWGIKLTFLSTVLGLILFFISQFGKKMAAEEMKILKNFITNISWKQ